MRSRRRGPDIDFCSPEVPVQCTLASSLSPPSPRLTLTATAAGSLDAGSSLRFGFVPQRAFQGQPASLSVVVRPSGVRCAASVRYADATLQRLPSVVARGRQGQLALADPCEGEDRLGDCGGLVRQGRQVRPQLHRRRAAVCTRACGRGEERLLAARRLHDTPRQLREPSSRIRRPRTTRSSVDVQVNFIDATNRVVQTEPSTSTRSARAPSTTSAARRRSPTHPGLEARGRDSHRGQQPKRSSAPGSPTSSCRRSRTIRRGRRRRRPDLNDHPTMLLTQTQISRGRLRLRREHHRRLTGGSYGAILPGVGRTSRHERRRRDPVRPRRCCQRLDLGTYEATS